MLQAISPQDSHPLSDLAYDGMALIKNQAEAAIAGDPSIQDAQAAGSSECAAFFRKAQRAEAQQHGVVVLQGKMGNGA